MDESTDQRIEAWTAVWEKVIANNPDFHGRGRSGLDSVLKELDRLYQFERQYALIALRNGISPSAGGSSNG